MTTPIETRNFKMHPKLLMDVIQRQAGTLSKAVLEGVMNAIDARATHALIALDANELLIKDDGEGFGSRENITKFFEVFGQPHEDSEKKTFGTFRMGRGQLFAFGLNEWQTGKYRMNVDIKNCGLDYLLEEKPRNVSGCVVRVKLYETIGLVGVSEIERDLKKWCKYAPIKIYFNDDLINVDCAAQNWEHDTDDAYIKLTHTGSLSVYNLGIHVCELPGHRFGCGGVVVSKKQLKVNFARNDIQSDCPVWKRIRPFINKRVTATNLARRTLDDDSRQRMVDQIRTDEVNGADCLRAKLFTAVTGRHFDARDVLDCSKWNCYSEGAKGDRLGDTLMRRGVAFVFASETLERWGADTVPELLREIVKWFDYGRRQPLKKFVPFNELTKDLDDKFVLLNENELEPREKLWLQVLSGAARNYLLIDGKLVYGWAKGRKLLIGDAKHAQGWTDGDRYVAIARSYLKARDPNVSGLIEVGDLLIHEACHQEPDTEEHDHDQAFYERHHDAVSECLGKFVEHALGQLPAIAQRLGLKLNKHTLKRVDQATAAEHKIKQFNEKAAARQ